MKRRTLIGLIGLGVAIAFIMVFAITKIDAKGFEQPKTTYVCTSSATYTPGTGEQKTTTTCVEQ